MSTHCPVERKKERGMSPEVMVTHEVTQFQGSNLVFGLLEELYSLSNKAIYAKFTRVSTQGGPRWWGENKQTGTT